MFVEEEVEEDYDEQGPGQGGGSQRRDSASENRRKAQKRASKKRTNKRSMTALRAEEHEAKSWRPRRCVSIIPRADVYLQFRWMCD